MERHCNELDKLFRLGKHELAADHRRFQRHGSGSITLGDNITAAELRFLPGSGAYTITATFRDLPHHQRRWHYQQLRGCTKFRNYRESIRRRVGRHNIFRTTRRRASIPSSPITAARSQRSMVGSRNSTTPRLRAMPPSLARGGTVAGAGGGITQFTMTPPLRATAFSPAMAVKSRARCGVSLEFCRDLDRGQWHLYQQCRRQWRVRRRCGLLRLLDARQRHLYQQWRHGQRRERRLHGFSVSSTAGNATLIADGGTGGGGAE